MPLPLLGLTARGAASFLSRQLPSIGSISNGLNIVDKLSTALPTMDDTVVAGVWGNALSTKRDMFRLALAICFGQSSINQLATVMAPFAIIADYDMMGKAVTVTLHYTYSGALNKASGNAPSGGAGGGFQDVFLNSVNENVVCGNYSGWYFNAGGATVGGKKPALPTGIVGYGIVPEAEKQSQPGPVGDGISRGTFLGQLFYSKLANPCENNQFYTDAYESTGVNGPGKNRVQVKPNPNKLVTT